MFILNQFFNSFRFEADTPSINTCNLIRSLYFSILHFIFLCNIGVSRLEQLSDQDAHGWSTPNTYTRGGHWHPHPTYYVTISHRKGDRALCRDIDFRAHKLIGTQKRQSKKIAGFPRISSHSTPPIILAMTQDHTCLTACLFPKN
jgi:hypothetical protein